MRSGYEISWRILAKRILREAVGRSCARSEGDLAGTDYEAIWGGAYVKEGVTGDEGESGFACVFENFGVGWGNDLNGIYAVVDSAFCGGHADKVIFSNEAQWTEKSVSVGGNGEVSGLTGPCAAGNAAGASLQSAIGIALQHDDGEAETRNLDATDRGTRFYNRNRTIPGIGLGDG
jgi:hypothetical protein